MPLDGYVGRPSDKIHPPLQRYLFRINLSALCSISPKDPFHLFIECPFSAKVWAFQLLQSLELMFVMVVIFKTMLLCSLTTVIALLRQIELCGSSVFRPSSGIFEGKKLSSIQG